MPTTTAGAIILDQLDNPKKVLLTQRNIPPFKGYWCLPGGHIDQYEEVEKAVIREVKEETGLDFKPHFFSYFDEVFREGNVHNVVLIFYGLTSGHIQIQESEVASIKWFTLEEAIKMDLAFTHNVVLKKFYNSLTIV